MNYILIAWIAGIASIGQQWSWPNMLLWVFTVMLVFICLAKRLHVFAQSATLLSFTQRINLVGLIFCVGYVYANTALESRLAFRSKQVEPISAVMYIGKIGEKNGNGVQQVAQRVDMLAEQNYLLQLKPEHVANSASTLKLGHYYAIEGTLKPPHGYAVPQVFDVERWYLSQNWQGRIKVKLIRELSLTEAQQKISDVVMQRHRGFIQHLRLDVEGLRLHFRNDLLKMPLQHRGLMLAMLTGDRSLLSPELEKQFERHGISHLLAISGPHVVLFAVMLCWFISLLINRYRAQWYLWQPRKVLLSIPFVLAVLGYAAFVGFEIPALRTLLSVLLISMAIWFNIAIRPLGLILLSAALLLWIDPFSILSAAFWLSYGACFVLLRVYQTLQKQQHNAASSKWRTLLLQLQLLWRSQWRIFIALLPLVLWIFGQVAWIAPLSNMLVIPLLGVVIVPLNMLAAVVSMVLPTLAQLLWHLADAFIGLLIASLSLLDRVIHPQLSQGVFTPVQIAGLGLAMLLLFMPRGSVPKFWVVLCLIPLLGWMQKPTVPQLSVIDVGQGQSVLLRDAQQNILIDTGGYYDESRFSIGEKVLLPYLHGQGIRQLDRVILSHLDQDHSGAYPALEKGMPVLALQSNEALDYAVKAPFNFCQMGQSIYSEAWQLQILWPATLDPKLVHSNQNDYSCIVYVQFYQGQSYRHFLIMGDAGFSAETELMQRYPDLKVDVLVLGHHGSRHSSSLAFLQHYHPQLTIASAGFDNRYGHPSPEVRERLKSLNIVMLNTAETGTISFTPTQPQQPQVFRQQRQWLQH